MLPTKQAKALTFLKLTNVDDSFDRFDSADSC